MCRLRIMFKFVHQVTVFNKSPKNSPGMIFVPKCYSRCIIGHAPRKRRCASDCIGSTRKAGGKVVDILGSFWGLPQDDWMFSVHSPTVGGDVGCHFLGQADEWSRSPPLAYLNGCLGRRDEIRFYSCWDLPKSCEFLVFLKFCRHPTPLPRRPFRACPYFNFDRLGRKQREVCKASFCKMKDRLLMAPGS